MKTKHFMKKIGTLLLAALIIAAPACGGTETENSMLIPDPHFNDGFVLTGFDSRPEFNQRDIGRIDYGQTGLSPVWRIGQWGCLKNLVDAKESVENGFDVFDVDNGSKVLKVNRETGAYSLNVDATKDGVYADGPRQPNDPWIHYILEVPKFQNFRKLKDMDYLSFYLEFELTKSEDHNGAAFDPNVHSAMFLWYLTIANVNNPGEYFWFGLPIYDSRYDFSPLFAAQDGGKEDSTSAFIYNPAADGFLDSPVRVGVPNLLSKDMLPTIRTAFNVAKERNFMKNTKYEDLCVTSMYIGWELPGVYDVGMDVANMQILYGKN